MAEITWYVLPKLRQFLDNLIEYKKNYKKPIYLIHLLATYSKETQKYGKEYFSDLDEILQYFNLDFVEYGNIHGGNHYDAQSRGTYFVAKI